MKIKRIEPRFKECSDCRFYLPANTHRTCKGCDVGEFFEAEIEELDPDEDAWLSPNGHYKDDDNE